MMFLVAIFLTLAVIGLSILLIGLSLAWTQPMACAGCRISTEQPGGVR